MSLLALLLAASAHGAVALKPASSAPLAAPAPALPSLAGWERFADLNTASIASAVPGSSDSVLVRATPQEARNGRIGGLKASLAKHFPEHVQPADADALVLPHAELFGERTWERSGFDLVMPTPGRQTGILPGYGILDYASQRRWPMLDAHDLTVHWPGLVELDKPEQVAALAGVGVRARKAPWAPGVDDEIGEDFADSLDWYIHAGVSAAGPVLGGGRRKIVDWAREFGEWMGIAPFKVRVLTSRPSFMAWLETQGAAGRSVAAALRAAKP